MSLDPLSVNSLGENLILDLISPKIFYKEKETFKSKLGEFRFDGKSLKFKSLKSQEVFGQSFLKASQSSLWKVLFKDFIFTPKKGVVCVKEQGCLLGFVNMLGVLRSKELSTYVVKDFKKGHYVVLKSNLVNNHTLLKKIKFISIQNESDGFKLLLTKKIDLFFPESFSLSLDPKFDYVFKKGQSKRISFYFKNNSLPDKTFVKLICESVEEIKKSFSIWDLTENMCKNSNIIFKNKKNIKLKEKITIVGNSKNTIKIVDLLYSKKPDYINLDYRNLKSYKLTKVLKSGDFDFYIDEELYDKSYPFLKEAYHSDGLFNTLKYKNKNMDSIFDNLESKTDFKDFFESQTQLNKILKKEESIILRLNRKIPFSIFLKSSPKKETCNLFLKNLKLSSKAF